MLPSRIFFDDFMDDLDIPRDKKFDKLKLNNNINIIYLYKLVPDLTKFTLKLYLIF